MKLESLKKSKFEHFKNNILTDTFNIKGGKCDTSKTKGGEMTDYFDTDGETKKATNTSTGEKGDIKSCLSRYNPVSMIKK